MADVQELAVELRLRSQQFDRGIGKSQKQLKTFTGQTDKAAASVKKAESGLSKLGKGLLQGAGIGGGFVLLTKGIDAVTGAVGGAIDAASDLEESQSKVDQVFTRSADTIRSWARSSAQAMGLSEQAALEAVGTFGNFIQALGNTEDEANKMSRSIVGLAADLASFNNQDIDEVILALRSGLAGEAEPMRRLGVSISAVRVENGILAKGLVKTKAEITDAMKVAERYAIIMEDTSKAQGDFERTSDGLANAQRIAAAEAANLSAQLGKNLLPAAKLVNDIMRDLTRGIVALTGGDGDGKGMEGLRQKVGLVADEFDDAAEAARDAASEWALTGTVADSFVDGLNDLSGRLSDVTDLSTSAGREFRTWRNELLPAIDALGLTERGLDKFIREAIKAGVPLERVVQGVRELREGVDGARQPLQSFETWMGAGADSADDLRKKVGATQQPLASMVGWLGEVEQGVRDVTGDVRDLSGALELVASGGFFKTQKADLDEAEQRWKRMQEGPDRNKVAIGKLRAAVELWSKREKRARKEGRDDWAALAKVTKRQAVAELRQRQGFRQSLKQDRDAIGKVQGKITRLIEFVQANPITLQIGAALSPAARAALALPGGGSPPAPPGSIPQFASGTPFVERTGLAVLHRGEAVTTASENRRGMAVTVRNSISAYDINGATTMVTASNRRIAD